MPRQARNPRTPRPDEETLTPKQINARHLHQLTDLAEKEVEASAIDLRDAGFTTYSAALRVQAVSSINVLIRLNEPSRISDLKRIRNYVDGLIDELEEPHAA